MARAPPHEREIATMLTDQRGYGAAMDVAAADPPRRHKFRDAATP
jgi:hypothetical protein